MLIKQGNVISLIVLVALVLVYLFLERKVRTTVIPRMRGIAAIDAMDEYVGRAVEMDRPIHFTPGGYGDLTHQSFGNVLAALRILGYIAELCATKGAGLICSISKQTTMPIAQDIVKSSYIKMGVPEKYTEETVQFTGGQYIARTIGNIERYNAATNIYIGDVGGSCWIICEAAARIGATQIGGTPNDSNMVVLSITSDYSLLGDELIVAASMIGGKPSDIASIWTMDYFKMLVILICFVSWVAFQLGNNWLLTILGQ